MLLTLIMGKSRFTAKELERFLQLKNPNAKLTCSIADLARYYIEEGEDEGVRGDIAFAQSCLETGFFRYGGQVLPNQNNFAGLGALDGNATGKCAQFKTAREGVRAQIQHLKAYASKEPLNNICIDPRFKYVARGTAEYVEYLGIRENPLTEMTGNLITKGVGWASGANYGKKIIDILASIIKVTPNTTNKETNKQESEEDKPDNEYEVIKDDVKIGTCKIYGSNIMTSTETFTRICECKCTINHDKKQLIVTSLSNSGEVKYVRC